MKIASLLLIGVAALGLAAPARAAELWKTLPAPVALPKPDRSGAAPVNDIQMYYAVYGQGRPVLLLHGGLANADVWGSLVPALLRQHRQVIIADSRGHGRSSRSAKPYSYELMASDVLALLDYLQVRKVDLVGWSDGGIIGLDIAIRHPERLDRLFAFGANADPSGLKPNVEKDPTFAAFIKRSGDDYRRLSRTPAEYDAFVEQIGRMWATQPSYTGQQLRSIRVRTAIADGEHDEAIQRAHTEYMARVIPGAKLVILPHVSHFAMLQDPPAFAAAVLGFLAAR